MRLHTAQVRDIWQQGGNQVGYRGLDGRMAINLINMKLLLKLERLILFCSGAVQLV